MGPVSESNGDSAMSNKEQLDTDESVIVRTNEKRTIYHTGNCKYGPTSGTQRIPLEMAKRMGLSECKRCSGEYQPHNGGDKSLYQSLKNTNIEPIHE